MLNVNLLNGGGGGTPDGDYKVSPVPFLKGTALDNTSSSRTNIFVKHPSDSDKVIIIHCASGTTIEFYTYDYSTLELVKLTKSGVSVSNMSPNEYPEALLIGSTIYFFPKMSTGGNLIYTFTISGTTITQGSSLDISSKLTNAENHYAKMATDQTDLHLITHSTSTKEHHKYDISATTWSTLTTHITNFMANSNGVSFFGRGTAKLYALGGHTTQHGVMVLEEFDIATDTWSIIGNLCVATSGYVYGLFCDYEEATSPVYFCTSNEMYEIDMTTAQPTFIGGGSAVTSNVPYMALSSGAGQYFLNSYFDSTNNKMLVPTVENGVFADMSDFLTGSQLSISGAGTFVGADTEHTVGTKSNTYNYLRQMIQIDGGDWLPIFTYSSPVGQQNYRIKFTTSLKVRNCMLQFYAGQDNTFCNAHYYEE